MSFASIGSLEREHWSERVSKKDTSQNRNMFEFRLFSELDELCPLV